MSEVPADGSERDQPGYGMGRRKVPMPPLVKAQPTRPFDVVNISSPCLRMEAAMTDEEKAKFKATWLKYNSRWEGAPVADILDDLDNHDAHCDVIDEFLTDEYDERGDEFGKLHKLAALALIYINEDATAVSRSAVDDLVQRAEAL